MTDIAQFIHSRAFTQKLLESLPCALLVFDQKGNVMDVNNVSKQLFGTKNKRTKQQATLGSLLNCLKADELMDKCGTDEYCEQCDVRILALSSIAKNEYQESTTQFQSVNDGHVKNTILSFSATPYKYKENKFSLVIVENLSSGVPEISVGSKMGFHGLIGQNDKMLDLYDTIRQIRSSNDPVLIQGESGTGKELVAMAIHRESSRYKRHFVPVNCGALPEGLLESEMFGHVKGAFTGATYNKKGRFKIADRGTIFLDEISEMSPSMQAKFLRVIETGSYEPVGSDQTVSVNVRVISATNRFIEKEINEGRFRRDLYYRLCVIPVLLPTLRARKDDIGLLSEYFLKQFSHKKRRRQIRLSSDAISLLENYSWPGNVRELQNILKYAVVKCQGNIITPDNFPYYLYKRKPNMKIRRRRKPKLNIAEVADALRKSKGNKSWAAEILGVSRSTLYRFFERDRNERNRV